MLIGYKQGHILISDLKTGRIHMEFVNLFTKKEFNMPTIIGGLWPGFLGGPRHVPYLPYGYD